MRRFGQVGIALGALGIILLLMGLFPGITGLEPTVGIGIVQVFMLLIGYGLLLTGALTYARFTFYYGIQPTLMQQIGVRMVLTGLLFGAMSGLSDIMGFGSHLRTIQTDIFFGPLQALGLLASFTLSSFGVLIYAVSGKFSDTPDTPDTPEHNTPDNPSTEL